MPEPALPRWIGALALLGAVLGCGQPGTRPVKGGPAASSLAVWSYRDLACSEREQAAFFEFAGRLQVGELFLGGSELLPRHSSALAAFLARAQDRGVRVSLVLGRAEWVRPDQQPAALRAVRTVRDFNLAQARAGQPQLAALQLDVEPHVLPDWSREGTRLAGQYLDLLEAIQSDLQGSLPIHVDIPVWWQGRPLRRRGQSRPLSEWVIRMADRTVLMDYRNNLTAIVDGAEGPLLAADTLGRPVVVGLAVHCERDQENAVTSFCRLGGATLRKVMGQADTHLARHRSYAGMAVFTYEDWLILKH